MAGICANSDISWRACVCVCLCSLRMSVLCPSQVPPHPTQSFDFAMSGVHDAHEATSKGIRVVRLFVELYKDAFGVFQKELQS